MIEVCSGKCPYRTKFLKELHEIALVTVKLYDDRPTLASRKPAFAGACSGLAAIRKDTVTASAQSVQEPPRMTLTSPSIGPVGQIPGLSL